MTALTIDRIIEVEDRIEIHVGSLLFDERSFTRSNGTLFARIYERLTKASRRRVEFQPSIEDIEEASYRRGVYDTLKALKTELK